MFVLAGICSLASHTSSLIVWTQVLPCKKLLELNERTAVLKYLEACSIFWESGQTALTYWWLAIKLGRKPKLDKQGPVELCFPDWLNGLAGGLMSLIRTMRR